ncbi:FG-GAP-like repeat-containing protein [candidate division KSB1 bacterium]|nr:FG-GAP-like repeat-containing protein [candidate division KSB1 bacterium]
MHAQKNLKHVVIIFVTLFCAGTIGVQAQTDFARHIISENAIRAAYVRAADIDRDGDIDVASTSSDADLVAWWENKGSDSFTRHDIDTQSPFPNFIFLVDLDRDLDVDVITTDHQDHLVSWYENDGEQNFVRHDVVTQFLQPSSVYVIDLDQDGDLDLLATAWASGELAWFANDGRQHFQKHVFGQNFFYARFIYPGDLDNDGDLDIVTSGAYMGLSFDWWENDGDQNFIHHNLDNQIDAAQIVLIDIDQDNDLDILNPSVATNQIMWWENNGQKNFQKHIVEENFVNAHGANAADLDGDGDIDLIGCSPSGKILAWWENDGQQNFQKHIIDANLEGSIFIELFDMNADGAIDIVTQSIPNNLIVWYENLMKPPVISATVKFLPPFLNSKIKFGFTAAFIELPDPFNVHKIDKGSISITAIEGQQLINPIPAKDCPWLFVDQNRNGKEELMIIFSRSKMIEAVGDRTSWLDFALTGSVEGKTFQGYDSIRVFNWHCPVSLEKSDEYLDESEPIPFPQDFELGQNYPNPFNLETYIDYQLPEESHTTIKIYNLRGQEIKTLEDEQKHAGYHSVRWDGRDNNGNLVVSGAYFYQIKAGEFVAIKKLVVLK